MSHKADSDSDASTPRTLRVAPKSGSKSESSEEVVSVTVVSQRPKQRVEVKEQAEPMFSDSDSDVDEYGIKQRPTSKATRAVTFEKELDSLKQQSAEEPNKLPPNVTGMFAGSKKNPELPKTLPYKRRFKPDEQAVNAAFKQTNEALNLAQQQAIQQAPPPAQAAQAQPPSTQPLSYTPMPPQGTTMPQPEMLMRYQPTVPQVQGIQAPPMQGFQASQGHSLPPSPEVAELTQQVRWLREQVLQLTEALAEMGMHRRSEFSEFQERYARAQRRLDRALQF
jgi:hypothetical protein